MTWRRTGVIGEIRPLRPEPAYIAKATPGDSRPWVSFGSERGEFQRWVPEICGICCLKMIGDTRGTTRRLSLYQLTMMAVANGTFVLDERGGIHGAYHHPLAKLAAQVGIPCEVEGDLSTSRICRELANDRYVILSVDLAKVDRDLRGGHLIVIYAFDGAANEVLLHDCSSVLRKNGRGISMSLSELEGISNGKGIIAG